MSKILVIGGSNIDYNASSINKIIDKDSNIGELKISYGGVARNIVENLARLDDEVTFITFLSEKDNGRNLKKQLEDLNVKVLNPESNYPSSSYIAIFDSSGDMKVAICDSKIIDNCSFEDIYQYKDVISSFDMVVLDANVNENIIDGLFKSFPNKKYLIEAVSANKVKRFEKHLDKIYLFKSNLLEARHLLNKENDSSLSLAKQLMSKGVRNVVITEGAGPVIIGENSDVIYITPKPLDKIVNATGAGDSLFAGLIHGLIHNKSLTESVAFGIKVSQVTLMSDSAVSPDIGKLKDLLDK